MKLSLPLAVVMITTALGTGTVALAAVQGRNLMPDPEAAGLAARQVPDGALTLISDGEEDDDAQDGDRLRASDGYDDDDDDDDDDDRDCAAEDDDDDCASPGTGNASKAGTVPPPRNGLFTGGSAPVVKSN